MSGPVTSFDADECQVLLDLLDNGPGWRGSCRDEQRAVLAKLREAGKFYIKDSAEPWHKEASKR